MLLGAIIISYWKLQFQVEENEDNHMSHDNDF